MIGYLMLLLLSGRCTDTNEKSSLGQRCVPRNELFVRAFSPLLVLVFWLSRTLGSSVSAHSPKGTSSTCQ